MITPARAITIADKEDYCKLGQHAYLWKTAEAKKYVKLGKLTAPCILISGPDGWVNPIEVWDESTKALVDACTLVNIAYII